AYIYLTTATGTRRAIKKSGANILSYELITNSPTRIRNKKQNNMSFMQEMETTPMEDRQIYLSQKEVMKRIAEFSGEADELDIDEWLFDLNNLFSLMKLKDETKILEAMGKLTGPALMWYQENLRSFITWNDAEKAIRDRFKEFTSNSQLMQEFFNIHQEENQSVISFYENVIRKYRKSRQFITEQQVITVLQNGVKNSLKEYLIRNEKEIKIPEEWLQLAKEEEYIQKRIQQQHNGLYSGTKNKTFFEHILPTATVQPTPSNFQLSSQQPFTSRHYYKQHHQQLPSLTNNRTHSKPNKFTNRQQHRENYPENKIQKSNPCLICNKNNHATIKCFYKKNNGCFKCGQSNHQIRDCSQQHFFE
ncbi:unnamed protein product, partial [Rotaria sp. Silwood1]